MTTTQLTLGTVSVQFAKPSQAYGSGLAKMPLKTSAAFVLVRANFPSTIPSTATVTGASLVFFQQDGPWTGSVSVSVARHTATIPPAVTWNTTPAVAAATDSISKSGAVAGTGWVFNVTTDVQSFINGTNPNYGWRIYTNSATERNIWSQSAPSGTPYLLVTYTVPTRVPSNQSPSGTVVSVAKPALSWTADPEQTAFQVQVDAASNPTTPGFDSGTVAGTAGYYDLSATAYAGLSNAATTYWRVRSQGPGGWSGYSAWAAMTRTNFGTLTITAPTTTPADPSPPVTWTYTGATQTAWQADLLDSTGAVVASSGQVGGSALAWTPTKGLVGNGSTGTVRVRVWDSSLRTATPGVPAYTEATKAITVTLSGAVTAMTTLVASQTFPSPAVILTGTKATGGIPDEVIVFRDGVQVDRFPGTDIFSSATAFTYRDWSAPMGKSATYRLAPVVSGSVASGGPTAVITPTCSGVWLVDVNSHAAGVDGSLPVPLWGNDAGSWDRTDLATVHQPISVAGVPVRRRLRRGILSGSFLGEIVDTFTGYDALDMIARLDSFGDNDAGTKYRLVTGHLNSSVIIGDLVNMPLPGSSLGNTWARVSFNFWGQ